MRILAIDYGRARIGVALSDAAQTISAPLCIIANRGWQKVSNTLTELIKKHEVGTVVIGLPLHADGRASDMSAETQKFGEYLRAKTDAQFGTEHAPKIVYYDERFTSQDAELEIRDKMGLKDRKKIAEILDSMAASMLLQQYMDSINMSNKRKGE